MVGLGSRRYCDRLVAEGRVTVDGERATSPAQRILPGVNRVALDGRALGTPRRPIVVLLNKPPGVVSTVHDPQGRKTVVDLCRSLVRGARVFPVGRLDINTTGALLLTNDGLLCYRLTHPRFAVPRVYRVVVKGRVDEKKLRALARLAGPAPEGKKEEQAIVLRGGGKKKILRIVLYQGRNRQVRRMCARLGLEVVELKRISFGPVSVRGLPLGGVRPLSGAELDKLLRVAQLKG